MLLPGEAHERRTHLVRERDEVQRLLEADAAVERLPLTRRLTFPSVSRAQLGLPTGIDACVFELDGVLTPSADLHFAAWSAVLDDFRRSDYEEHFEGRPRLDGLRLFLASRGLTVPERTIRERTDAKNRALQALLRREGVTAFAGATRYLEALAGSGLASVVVSASANTIAILGRAGIRDLVDVVVDGNRMADLDLRPKPAADVVVAACEELGLRPLDVACFEIAAAGVEAARAAGAGLVVFVARHEAKALPADRVIGDLAELLV
jgi:HAD superfamily hydrolase (TIGR01509 family)